MIGFLRCRRFFVLVFFLLVIGRVNWAAETSSRIVIENQYYRYIFDVSQGLKLTELFNAFTKENNLKDPTNLHLAMIDVNGERSTLDAMTVTSARSENGQATFTLESPSLQCLLTIAYNETPETRWMLSVTNTSGIDAKMKVVFPLLSGLVPGDSLEDVWFHHGLNGQVIGRQPVTVCGSSGYSFPVMDIFNKSLGGVYLISKDPNQNLMGYELIKKEPGKTPPLYSESYWEQIRSDGAFGNEWGCGMAVVQGTRLVKNSESFETAPAAVGVHPGRWEKAWESYRTWLRSVTTPRSDNSPRWWREVFISKAIHEGHYWKNGKFDWTDTIQSFDRNAYFDINHWMNNRGDYVIRPDQGGAAAWKAELAKLRQKGIHSAFYLEACCANPLSEVGKAHPDWGVMSQGKRFQENGENATAAPESREYNMCPGSPWKEYLATTAARVLRESNIDAVYLDSMALRFWICEDTAHDHAPGEGWRRNVGEALRLVNREIDRVKMNTPVYCEYWSSDINSQYMNGSYSPGVAVTQGVTSKGFDFCRTGTNLFRFYFPKFKIMEICDINEKNIGMALFNGNGLHESFTNQSVWPYLNECARIWEQNLGAFTSDQPEALVETGNADLFMNKFPDNAKTVYTFWNVSQSALSQTPVTLKTKANHRYIELFSHREFKAQGDALLVDVPFERAAVVAETPIVLKLEKSDSGEIAASYEGTYTEPSLVVYAKIGDQCQNKAIPFEKSEIPVNNNTVYDPGKVGGLTSAKTVRFNLSNLFEGQTVTGISLALLDGKKLIDEVPWDR